MYNYATSKQIFKNEFLTYFWNTVSGGCAGR